MLISKVKIIFISVCTILKNREFPFFHFFHYKPFRNYPYVTFKRPWGQIFINVSVKHFIMNTLIYHTCYGMWYTNGQALVSRVLVGLNFGCFSPFMWHYDLHMTLENSATGMLFIGLVCILGPYNTSDKTLFVYLHIFEQIGNSHFFNHRLITN